MEYIPIPYQIQGKNLTIRIPKNLNGIYAKYKNAFIPHTFVIWGKNPNKESCYLSETDYKAILKTFFDKLHNIVQTPITTEVCKTLQYSKDGRLKRWQRKPLFFCQAGIYSFTWHSIWTHPCAVLKVTGPSELTLKIQNRTFHYPPCIYITS